MNQSQAEQLLQGLQKQINSGSDLDSIDKGSSMFSWTIEQLCDSTDGDLLGPLFEPGTVQFSSISTDTRTIQPGALYIAIKGERFDGHAFIEQAVKQGAVAVLVSEAVDTLVPGVLVEDTRIALGEFAKWHRLQMPVKKLIAVTGSNGKTSVKTLLNEIFSGVGKTLATEGNLNNDFGVPRTLLNLRPEHEFAVIEMGANHLHEIGYLTALALPDVAIVNNAAGAHLEGFGSLQGVIDTKGEIFQGLNQIAGRPSGVAVINTDSAGYEDWQQMLKDWQVSDVRRFGTSDEADVKLTDFSVQQGVAEGIEFSLTFEDQVHPVTMPMLGYHNAMNAAACTTIALGAGLNWQDIEPAIRRFTGVAGRLQKNAITTGWLIDDSYNANPESVKAGIEALVSLPGKAMLCLGAMAEIGEQTQSAHEEIAEYAKQKGVEYLFVYGQAAQTMPKVFGNNSGSFDSHEQMKEAVAKVIDTEQQSQQKLNLLIKGSRSASMEKLANPLLEQFKLQQD